MMVVVVLLCSVRFFRKLFGSVRFGSVETKEKRAYSNLLIATILTAIV